MPESGVSQDASTIPDGQTKLRIKRSRTGCLTCRTRRRKCDEGRPVCQNCIAKKIPCRYAALYQILGKNNYTPEVESNGKYADVQFVESKNEITAGTEPEATELTGGANWSAANIVQGTIVSRQMTDLQGGAGCSPTLDTDWQKESPFQLGILLQLERRVEAADLISVSEDGVDHEGSYHTNTTRPAVDANSISTRAPIIENQASSGYQNAIPAEAVLSMLRTYRYQVAPWLDICDRDQSFGVQVLALCAESKTIRDDVLSLIQAMQAKDRAVIPPVHVVQQAACGAKSTLHLAVSSVFRLLGHVMVDLAGFWDAEGVDRSGRRILDILQQQLSDGSSLIEVAYWLVVRLVLSCALMNATPIRLPLPFLAHSRFISASGSDMASITQNAIALCVDAVMYAQGDDDQWLQQRYGLNRAEIWQSLVHGLDAWFEQRPQEFLPIIELYPKDGMQTNNEFPSIVFTSGAALLANQMYHCGMMLLLHKRPRFTRRYGLNSPSMSTLWHVHRICGIAIQNDESSTWDPCLLASLLVAARNITHSSQQTAIVRTLETVRELTGWNVSRHVEELRSEWRLANGW